MKKFHQCGVFAALLVALSVGVSQAAADRTQIMILGTFHFEGSGSDAVSVTMGDMLGARRQAEVDALLDRLAAFRPTRIMVEVAHHRNAQLNEQYARYLAGEYVLTANEVDQLGMRLAKRLGHERLYAVDHQQSMDFDRMMKAGAEAGQQDVLGWFQQEIVAVQKALEEAQGEDKSLVEALLFHNGPWAMQGNGLYLKLASLGTSENPAGAEVIGGWYVRNLKIYANIVRAIEQPGERVLVIYGSGHLPQLVQFFSENPDFEVVSALDVLVEGGAGRH